MWYNALLRYRLVTTSGHYRILDVERRASLEVERSMPGEDQAGLDMFQLLEAAAAAKQQSQRQQLLASLNIREFFGRGEIQINQKTCRGVECKLCIDVCPTHALYWAAGAVGVEEALCVYCAACVLSCIVDDCIHVQRTRSSGEVEGFSSPQQVHRLLHAANAQKKIERMTSVPGWMPISVVP